MAIPAGQTQPQKVENKAPRTGINTPNSDTWPVYVKGKPTRKGGNCCLPPVRHPQR